MSWLVRMTIDSLLAYEKHMTDSYAWHQALWNCFPGKPDKKRDFLPALMRTKVFLRHGY